MLSKYAERLGFQAEPLEIGEGKYTFAIKGPGAYSVFKFEGGTHRVQRVPQTESQGRVHTSTATVAVLPEAEALGTCIKDWLMANWSHVSFHVAHRRIWSWIVLSSRRCSVRRSASIV
jgi:hypothetical protein